MAKHPDLAIIMAGHKPAGGDDDEHDEGMSAEEHEGAMQDASDEVFDALVKRDKSAFGKALAAFVDLHENAPEAGEDEDDDEDEDEDKGSGLRL